MTHLISMGSVILKVADSLNLSFLITSSNIGFETGKNVVDFLLVKRYMYSRNNYNALSFQRKRGGYIWHS